MVLPRCVRRIDLPLGSGPIAALEARPERQPAATALLVPGFSGSKEDFLPLLEPLADAGLRVVCVDQRGQCDSPGLADPAGYPGARYGDGAFGSDVRELVRLLAADGTGPVHLLGHSFGGYAVREGLLGTAAGSRLPLASLTLLDSGPAAVTAPDSRQRLELLLSVEGQLTLRQMHELSPVDEHDDPQVREFLLRRWLANDPASLYAMARQLRDEPDRTDRLKALLTAWELPCLVVSGTEEDVWSAELLRETADRLGAAFMLIADAGHSPNTQQPEALVKALLEFWLG